MFYVYEWFIIETNEIIYVGKGCGKRYKVKNRNELFNKTIKDFDCDVRIIKYFDIEIDAFQYEKQYIENLKSLGQCKCNYKYGGYGGVSGIWTDEMKKEMSINNPMKDPKQKQRMSTNNPMKITEIAKKVHEKKKRAIIINGIKYDSQVDAAQSLNVWTNTILTWLRKGYDGNGNPCRYANEQQKDFNFKKTNSKKVKVNDQIFNSVKEAADYIGCWSETIIRCIKNNKLCHGYKCEYDNQQLSYGNQ